MKYSLELLKAINEWQSIGSGDNKERIAREIIKNSSSLPDKFKSLSSSCYRRIALSGNSSLKLGVNMDLPETYSSWTVKKSVAMTFNGGVPPLGEQGVIFKLDPSSTGFEVVLNLNEIYNDSDFAQACREHKENIESYKTGIGFFGNSEAEVILKVDKVKIEQFWAYGGFSSSREKLAELFFGSRPKTEDLREFDRMIQQRNVRIGGNWITGKAKDRVIAFHQRAAAHVVQKRS